jgi:hypothetical protein
MSQTSENSKKVRGRDLLPSMGELREAARQVFNNRGQGPLHRLGMDVSDVANLEKLPQIRRARDYHLLDFKGRRYLDLFRGEGANLLGYSVNGFQLAIKNRLSQALWQGMPHPLYKQVKKTLERCFPGHTTLICPDHYRIQILLELLGIKQDRPLLPLATDLTGVFPRHALTWWFPFTGAPAPVAVALIPSLGIQGPYVLLVDNELYAHHLTSFGTHEHEVFSILDYIGHAVPVYALAGMISGLSALEGLGAFAGTGAVAAGGNKLTLGAMGHPRTAQLQQHLGLWRESAWQSCTIGAWKRVGPWLHHGFSPAEYAQVFAGALERGIVLNPRASGINCLPGLMSKGEQAILEETLAFDPRV